MGQSEAGQAGPIPNRSTQRKLPLPAIDPWQRQALPGQEVVLQILKHPPLTSSKPAGQAQVQSGC